MFYIFDMSFCFVTRASQIIAYFSPVKLGKEWTKYPSNFFALADTRYRLLWSSDRVVRMRSFRHKTGQRRTFWALTIC